MGMFFTLIPQIDATAGLGLIFISSFVQGIGWNELTNRVSYKISDKAIDLRAAMKVQPSPKDASKAMGGSTEEERGLNTDVPRIISKYPLPDQTDVGINSPIIATFSKPIDVSTVTTDTFTLRRDDSDISIDVEKIEPGENLLTVILKPSGDLQKGTKYIVTVRKEIKDQSGNQMASDETWSFITSAL
jgi:hypothetical protein